MADSARSPPVPVKKTIVIVNEFIINTNRFLNHFASLAEEKLAKVSADIERVETALVLLESRLSRVPGMEDTTVYPPTAVQIVLPAGPAVGAPAAASAPPSSAQAATASGAGAAPQPPSLPPPVPTQTSTVASSAAGLPPPPIPPAAAAAAPPPPPAQTAVAAGAGAGAGGDGSGGGAAGGGGGGAPPVSQHPDYAPFFRMIRMGVPAGGVKQKVALAGLDPAVLDLDPNTPWP